MGDACTEEHIKIIKYLMTQNLKKVITDNLIYNFPNLNINNQIQQVLVPYSLYEGT